MSRNDDLNDAYSQAAQRLDELGALQPGWLDGSGKSISKTALALVQSVVGLRPSLTSALIFPTEDGGCLLEWETNGWDFGLECTPHHLLKLSGVEIDGTGEFQPICFDKVDDALLWTLEYRRAV